MIHNSHPDAIFSQPYKRSISDIWIYSILTEIPLSYYICFIIIYRAPPWSSGSVLDHRSLPPVFESRRGHI